MMRLGNSQLEGSFTKVFSYMQIYLNHHEKILATHTYYVPIDRYIIARKKNQFMLHYVRRFQTGYLV